MTRATGVAVSSSLALTTPLIAPIAEAPQIENPVAISSGWWPGSRSARPSPIVPTKVSTTITTIIAIDTQPRPRMSTRLSFSPSSTTPRRMNFLDATRGRA